MAQLLPTLCLLSLSASLLGQDAISLTARDARAALLQPGGSPVILPITADPSAVGGDVFHIILSEPGAEVVLTTPAGNEVNAENAEAQGYAFIPFTSTGNTGFVTGPYAIPGNHTFIELPPGAFPGEYIIKVLPGSLAAAATVRVFYNSSSPIRIGLSPGKRYTTVGKRLAFSVFVYEGNTPLSGATATLRIRSSDDLKAPGDPDIDLPDSSPLVPKLGDGLYLGVWSPTTPGNYTASVKVTGVSGNGIPYSRIASTDVTILPALATLDSFSDAAVDDNGDGVPDRVAVTATANVQTAGNYELALILRSKDRVLTSRTPVALTPGRARIAAGIAFTDLATLGEDGPYAITNVRLTNLDMPGLPPADERPEAGRTGAYVIPSLSAAKPLTISPSTLAFGDVETGVEKTLNLVLANAADYPFSPAGFEFSNTSFKVDPPPAPFTVPAKGSITLTVRFRPLAAGAQTAVLTIAGITVNLTGTGTAAGASNPAPVITSISPERTFTGGAAFTLTVNGSGFVRASTIRWNGSARVTTFVSASVLTAAIPAADIAAAGTAQITVLSPAPGGGTSGASAFTVLPPIAAGPAIAVSPSTLDFGSVTGGQTKDLTITIRNTGTATLNVSGFVSSNARFAITGPTPPFTVNASSSQSVNIRFSPNTTGPQTGTLTIASNDSSAPSISVSLAGTGSSSGGTFNCTPSAGNLVANGSFEFPGTPLSSLEFGPGGSLPCWTILSGTIDYVGTTWNHADGLASLDLDGRSPGAIEQTFATTPGTSYTVSFDLAGNWFAGSAVKQVRVSAAGQSVIKSFDTTGKSNTSMGWLRQTFTFTASATTTTLQFASLSPTGSFTGPTLDNVVVAPGSGTANPCAATATNLLGNGSFELPGTILTSLEWGPGSLLPCWTIVSGTIDYVGVTWNHSNGKASLDLDGRSPGAIEQTFPTTPGTTYTVTFDMAGNWFSGPAIKQLRVSAAGQDAVKSFNTSGKSNTNMGWLPQTFTFTASAATTTLQFASLSPAGSPSGPTLDNVVIAPAGGGGGTGGGGTGGGGTGGANCPSTENLALTGTARQSSEGFGGLARFGNNGVIEEPNGFGFHTDAEQSPWWEVDLGAVMTICEVRMYNRKDGFAPRAATIQVLLSTNGTDFTRAYAHDGSTWGNGGMPPLAVVNEVSGRSARYVRVQINAVDFLHLREVEVYGSRSTTGVGGGGTGGGTAPSIAVSPATVDFGSVAVGSSGTRTLTITNTGTAPLNMTGLTLTGPYSVTPASFSAVAPNAAVTATLTFRPIAAGAQTGSLAIASNDAARPSLTVPLTGTGTAGSGGGTGSANCPSTENLALTGTARQSSEGFGGLARFGNNGVIEEPNGFGFHTDAEQSPWWEVDLGAITTICEVRMYNRKDESPQRARTIRILLSTNGTDFTLAYAHDGSTWGVGGTPPLAVINEVRGRTARYVRVQLNEINFLHLREVEVYGSRSTTGGGGGTGGGGTGAGTGTAPLIAVAPATVDFGGVAVGSTVTRTVAITNTGTAPLNVTGLVVTGPFTVTPATLPAVAANATASVTLTFRPTAAGAQTGSLAIASNDSTRPSLTVSLAGTGTAASTAPVVLQVDDGTFEIVVGFPNGGVNASFVTRLTPPRYPATLRSVQVYFPEGELPLGTNVTLLSVAHPTGSGADLLNTLNFTRTAARITAFERFVEYDVAPVTITSGDFIVGFAVDNPREVFPAALDSTAPSSRRSYVSSDGVAFRLLDTSTSIGPGNFGIRAKVQ